MEQQELTPAQLERIKQQKIQRFKSLGLPGNAGQLVDVPVENVPKQRVYEPPAAPVVENVQQQYDMPQNTSNVVIPNESDVSQQIQIQLAEERAERQRLLYTAPRDKFNALDAIKKGAKRQEFRTFLKAESNGGKGGQLPEPKVGRKRQTRPGQPQEKSKSAVPVQTYNVPKIDEAENLESLFTDRAPGISMRNSGNNVPQGNLIQTDENYSNIGPSYDPVLYLKKKAAEKGINIDFSKKQQQQQSPQVFQTDNSEQMSKMMLMMETLMKTQQKNSGYDLATLKEMMETIAKKAAEDMIKKVLREYAEGQKKKNIYEVANKEKNIIKINDKFYQLKQVVPVTKATL